MTGKRSLIREAVIYSQAVHERLIQVAHEQGYVQYKEVADLAGIRITGGALSDALKHLLRDITLQDLASDPLRPMICAVALGKDAVRPGNGFFELARELKRLHSAEPRVEDAFWVRELKALYEYWETH
jgi:hypothetical protein